MSLKAYQTTAQRTENPRLTEYRLFAQVTRALLEVEKLDRTKFRERMEALDWNRRMWSVLAADCSVDGNGLPDMVRANIISLSIWVNKHTSLVMRNQEEIGPLIEINRIIMQGLAPGGADAGADVSAAPAAPVIRHSVG
jgi:flagellar protein FlaF